MYTRAPRMMGGGDSPVKRRTIPLQEVAATVSKSSKVALSMAEASDAVLLLTSVCPSYVTTKTYISKEWVVLVGAVGLREVKERIRLELARSSSS